MPKYLIRAEATFAYYLVLNNLYGNMENGSKFGPFETLESAKAFYEGEKVTPYIDKDICRFSGVEKEFSKTFRKGGLLENFNPLREAEWLTPNCFGHGVHEVLQDVDNVQKIAPM